MLNNTFLNKLTQEEFAERRCLVFVGLSNMCYTDAR